MPRVIYSLSIAIRPLDKPLRPGESMQLIVPLNAQGQSENGLATAIPPKQRVIDLRTGDWLRHRRRPFEVLAIRAYREATAPDGYAPRCGYVVRAG